MSNTKPPSTKLLDLYVGQARKPLYTTKVTVRGGESGHGRASGQATSDDGELNLNLRLPPALGGKGGGTNPEQLFAAGFAACFHGAMMLVAAKNAVALPSDTAVSATVTFGRDPDDGLFYLETKIEVKIDGLGQEEFSALIQETETICPYAKIGRQGMVVSIARAA